MLQQINLYKLLPVKSRFQLTPMVAGVVYGVFIFVLLLIYGLDVHANYRINKQFELLVQQEKTLQQQLDTLNKQYPVSDAPGLNKALEELQTQLTMKAKMLNSLIQRNNFATYLTGLAGMDVNGLWLTEIAFNNVIQKIDLKGFALQTVLIDKAIEQLNAQSAFAGLKFEVQNVVENPAPTSFEISAKSGVAS